LNCRCYANIDNNNVCGLYSIDTFEIIDVEKVGSSKVVIYIQHWYQLIDTDVKVLIPHEYNMSIGTFVFKDNKVCEQQLYDNIQIS
jgi:hypothetical protein